MSLGGLALAIGVLVDAAIVMVENGYRHLAERQSHPPDQKKLPFETAGRDSAVASGEASPSAARVPETERRSILLAAAQQVGPALFFSLIIIVVSFLPVFLLEAQEGRMFKPLHGLRHRRLHFFGARHHSCARAYAAVRPRPPPL